MKIWQGLAHVGVVPGRGGRSRRAPSPRLRGEGWAERQLVPSCRSRDAPSPGRRSARPALSPRAGRGERSRNSAVISCRIAARRPPARRPPGGDRMRQARLVSIAFALLVAAGSVSAPAQQQVPLPMQPAPPGPYKSIAVTLPPRQSDASLDAFRKELGDIAKKKDSAALAAKVVTKGFFWQREDSDDADAKKSGIDNLAAALGLNAPDGSGWQALANYAADVTTTALPEMKGIVCSPATPSFDEDEMEKVAQSTRTDAAYPSALAIDIRAKAHGGAAL